MVVYSSVEYTTTGSLPYILLFTQALTHVWFDVTIIDINTILVDLSPTRYILLFTQALTRVWFDATIIDINTILLQYYSGYVGV